MNEITIPIPPSLYPLFELIIAIVYMCLLMFILIMFILGIHEIFNKTLSILINLMWRDYDIHGKHPPDWRLNTSIYLHAIKNRDLDNIETIKTELNKREGRDLDE